MRSEKFDWSSITIFRFIGYVLVILNILDIAYFLIPPRLMNPVWEFQTIGQLVERTVVPLLGLILIFYASDEGRNRWELWVLRVLSWLSLLVGIVFILFLPLLIVNSYRINTNNRNQIYAQLDQQQQQIDRVKSQLDQAKPEDFNRLLNQIKQQFPSETAVNDPSNLKQKLYAEINRAEATVKAQAQTTLRNQYRELLKNTVKWGLGTLIAGTAFLYIWFGTRWVRS